MTTLRIRSRTDGRTIGRERFVHLERLEPWALLYARLALGAAFLSAVASRLGLWGGGSFESFVRYTAEVNSFAPAGAAPALAWAATAAELVLGLALVAGVRLRWAAAGSAALLLLFGAAMGVSFGIKEPLDYSVFSASAGALLVALYPRGERSRAHGTGASGPAGAAVAAWLARGVPVDGAWAGDVRACSSCATPRPATPHAGAG